MPTGVSTRLGTAFLFPRHAAMAELKTFVFTDISGSVRLKDEMTGRSVTERDQAFIQSILTPHRQRIEARLAEFGGPAVLAGGGGAFPGVCYTLPAGAWG